ncbi:MAG: substrate-binding domain-containing protein [Verrucomicrobiales bacterium]
MKPLQLRSVCDQVAEYLREEILRGTWREQMPGVKSIAGELGVNHKTVEGALAQLEREGILEAQGAGRRRRIVVLPRTQRRNSLRIAVLLLETVDRQSSFWVHLQHSLEQAGHHLIFPAQSVSDLGACLDRVRRLVSRTDADAWLVDAGSHDILTWFASQPVPVFAIAGRPQGLSMPATWPDKVPAIREAVQGLVGLGHRRIVLLSRSLRRKPTPGVFESAFLDELDRHGITPSSFNLPDWKEEADGFHSILGSLFKVTPPTAVILDEAVFVAPFLQFCSWRGVAVPRDVSIMCNTPDPSFAWFQPSVTHIGFDAAVQVRRVVRWARNVGLGRTDLKQSASRAKLIWGGTIARSAASWD